MRLARRGARMTAAALAAAAAGTVAVAAVAALAGGASAIAAPAPAQGTPVINLPTATPSLPVALPTVTIPVSLSPLPTLPIPISPVPLPSLPLAPPSPGIPLPTPVSGTVPSPGGIPGATFPPPNSPFVPGAPPPGTAGSTAGSPLDTSSAVFGQLLSLLGTPPNVGVEQPSLEHFTTPVNPATLAAAAAAAHGTPAAASAGNTASGSLVIAASLLAACGIALAGGRGRRRWYRPLGIAALPAALALSVVAFATGAPTVATRTAAAPLAAALPSPAATVSRTVPAAGYGLLSRVAGFENTIAVQAAEIRRLGVLIQQQQPAPTDPAARPGSDVRAPDLAGLQHGEAVNLEATLQQEYDLFASIAADPAQATALVAAASTQGASVRDAVSYDVQAVQAALAQQAAIAMAARAPANVPPTSGFGAGSVPTGVAGPAGALLTYPLDGPITQGFGPTSLSFEPAVNFGGVTYPHFHTGLDIAGPLDSTVRAAADSVVALAGAETDGRGHLVGYGNYVVLANGHGMITLYAHLDHLLVQAEQVVHAGDPIGEEGSTGNSTGPHLHFEVRVGGLPVDPLGYLSPR